MRISLFYNAQDNAPKSMELTWERLRASLLKHEVTPCAPCPGKHCEKKNGRAWSPTDYAPDATRGEAGVLSLTALVLDVDGARPDVSRLQGTAFVLHSTHSGGYRVVVPLARPLSVSEWRLAWPRMVASLGIVADEKCKDPPRLYYFPSAPAGVTPVAESYEGAPLDPGPFLTAAAVERFATPATPAPPPAVDLDALRAALKSVPDDKRHLVARVLAGEPLAPVGEQDDSLLRLADAFAWLPDSPPAPFEAVLALCERSLRAMGWQQGFEHCAEEFRKKYARHVERRTTADAEREATRAELAGLAASEPEKFQAEQVDARRRMTDLWNAERFVQEHGSDVRYVASWGKWLCWSGSVWKVGDEAQAMRLALTTVKKFYAECASIEDKDERQALFAHALSSERRRNLESIIGLARHLKPVSVSHEDFDANPFVLSVANGTLDLKTGILRPHRREDHLTKITPIAYDPAARAPVWEKFLERVLPSPELRAWLARAVGYALTGDIREQVLFFLHGKGANGKSTFLKTITKLLGDYAKPGAPDLLLARPGTQHPTELAALAGARLVVCSEVEQGRSFAEKTIKELTGGDLIAARFMRQDFFHFAPTHKIMLAANHRPRVRGTDEAIWRRLRLVPFEVIIPEGERDKTLELQLEAELPGILAWAVRGCLEWQKQGLGAVDAVQAATKRYRADQDHLAQFLEERCELDGTAWTSSTDLYVAYTSWCETSEGERPWTKRALVDHLPDYGLAARTVKHVRGWTGVRLKNAPKQSPIDVVDAAESK